MTHPRPFLALAAAVAVGSSILLAVPATASSSGQVAPEAQGAAAARDVADCRLARVPNDLAEGFPIHSQALPATGTLRAALLLVDFPDAAAAPGSQAEAIANLQPGIDYLERASGGRLEIEVTTTPDWVRMPRPATDYPFDRGLGWADHVGYVRDAVTAADPVTDFSGVDVVWVTATREAPSISFSPTTNHLDLEADGTRLRHAVTFGYDQWSWGGLVLAHETGHTLGLPDLYLFDAPPGDPGGWHSAVGGWDVMGLISGAGPEMLAWHRWMLGWIDDSDVVCADPDGSVADLTSVAEPDGEHPVALVLPLSATRAVVVEHRRAVGHDHAIAREGALVTTVDTSVRTGRGPVRVVDATPGTGGGLDDAPFRAGETWTEPTTGTTLTFSDGPDGTIRVQVGDPVAPELPLQVTAVARCVAGQAVVAVRAVNGHTGPVDVAITSELGSRTITSVAPGKAAVHTFGTRSREVEAGSVSLTAAGEVDGERVTTVHDVGHLARSC